jgi:hypothetical protein
MHKVVTGKSDVHVCLHYFSAAPHFPHARKVPALPREIIEPLLWETGLSVQDIQALLRSNEWNAGAFRNQQAVLFLDFTQIECGGTLSAAQIGKVLRIQAEQVRCKAGFRGKCPHRPVALDANQEMVVVDFIRAGYVPGNYVTRRDVPNFIERKFRKYVRFSRILSFLARNEDVV